MLDERTLSSMSFSEEDSLALVVNPKETGIGDIGLGGNGSVFEDLGLSDDSGPYMAGAGVAFVCAITLGLYLRRRV